MGRALGEGGKNEGVWRRRTRERAEAGGLGRGRVQLGLCEVWNKLFREETKRDVLGFLMLNFYLLDFT